jgi:hypothetical protein
MPLRYFPAPEIKKQIDEIAKMVLDNVYPMISDYENARRQFKVLRNQNVTAVLPNLDQRRRLKTMLENSVAFIIDFFRREF